MKTDNGSQTGRVSYLVEHCVMCCSQDCLHYHTECN